MKQKYFALVFLLLFIVSLAGCGGGQGAAGSSGGNTGIIIQADSVSVTSPDIDTAVHMCPSGNPEPALTRTDAVLNVTTAKLNPDTASADPFPASVEQCTITYKKADENPDAPIIPEFTQYPNCPLVEGSNTCNLTLMDIQRKTDFWNALSGGTNTPATYPVHYVAVVNCTYKNQFGDTGNFQTEVDIWLADFDLCGA